MISSPEGHRERMRGRAEQMDKEDIRSQDLVELMLYYALPRRDTKDLAAGLMEKFGSLEALFAADETQIAQAPGIGKNTAAWLAGLGRLFRAYTALEADDRPHLSNHLRSERYIKKFFEGFDYPEVWQFSLSAGGWLLGADRIADCAAWGEPEYLRQALGSAMELRSHSIIIGQFSVNNIEEVDEYDERMTMRYSHALIAAGIQLLDHMIICPDGVISLYKIGKLDRMHQLTKSNALRENYLLREADEDEEEE